MARISISDVFKSKFSPRAGSLPQNWTEMQPAEAAMFVLDFESFSDMPIFLNLATAWVNWWAVPHKKRRIISVKPATAIELRKKDVNFTPAQPPGTWGGRAVVVEAAKGRNLVGEIWSIAGYMNSSITRSQLEICVVWMEGDGAFFASFPAGVGIQIAETPEITDDDRSALDEVLDLESYIFDDGPPEYRRSAVAALKMLLAASYRTGSVFKLQRDADFAYVVTM